MCLADSEYLCTVFLKKGLRACMNLGFLIGVYVAMDFKNACNSYNSILSIPFS